MGTLRELIEVEGYVWCDQHGEVHAATSDPYGLGYPECGTTCWRTLLMADDDAPARPVDADVDPVSARHPETARKVAARLSPGSKRRAVHDWIAGRGEVGATADEVSVHFGWGHQSASAAVSTLKRDGWLCAPLGSDGKPRTRPTRSGNPAEVMVTRRFLPFGGER